jgi:transposase InsO family protein
VLKFINFRFALFIPPLGDFHIYQPSVKLDDAPEPDETMAQPEVPSAAEGEALRIEGERNGVMPNTN